ncbi:GNAT family N-acetyltransferase [Deinococcus sp. Arct2-2]|uniref:GNAT family N-acetyltransferase n=1 Tax=Deinococcus sp. Arct2-2 TaxID=2568653 RepID=UPI0010A49077|nr:GNAT family N-acetyltransferase [Deinococcus sp. Arct2-2]THF70277.1 GNAT family N-acetyltransferase [Deinococcus sp. Arct2-2]
MSAVAIRAEPTGTGRIEVRPFDGDPAELAALINLSWQGRYLARDLIPVYDAQSLGWQVLDTGEDSHDFRLAAYDGGRLVGCFLADRLTLRVGAEIRHGTQGSYLSVHPDYASRGVATRLINALERAHRRHGLEFMLGYVNAAPHTPAAQFWTAFQRAFPARYRPLKSVHFWMRFLNARAVVGALGHPAERAGLRALSALQGGPRRNTVGRSGGEVRPYTLADLPACHLLLDRAAARSDLAQLWDASGLAHQFHSPPQSHRLAQSHTLVSQIHGHIQGFSTSFAWPLHSRSHIPAEAIDLLLLDDLTPTARRHLLHATAAASAERGAWLTLAARTDARHAATFLACGFIPVPQVCTLMLLFPAPNLRLDGLTRVGPLRLR